MTLTDTDFAEHGPLERQEWGAFIGGAFVPMGHRPTFEVVEPSTLHEFVQSKAVRFRSGRGEVPVWPPKR
jgi:hypothetical protein